MNRAFTVIGTLMMVIPLSVLFYYYPVVLYAFSIGVLVVVYTMIATALIKTGLGRFFDE